MKIAFHTLGCKVNQYETEAIKESFRSRGAEVVPEDAGADVYVVNTCTVTNIADRKSRQFIRRMKSRNKNAIMVVTGCYAQVEPEELESMPEVDLIIGNDLKSEIVDRVSALYDIRNSGECGGSAMQAAIDVCNVNDGSRPTKDTLSHVLYGDQLNEYEDLGNVTYDDSGVSRAYIKIEDGCDRYCSYCRIPYARGRVRSRNIDSILDEAASLVDRGYREIVLTGINTALYGADRGADVSVAADEDGLSGLAVLIKRIDALDGDFRIRLSSLEPTVVDRNDVERLLGYEKLCHHLHLSVQSGSDGVLRAMNRHYTVDDYMEIVDALKAFDPLYGITTDIITGFPGETEYDHRLSIELVERAGFGRVHIFRYSPRRGTAAAEMPDRIDGTTSARRSDELEEAADRTVDRFIENNLGTVQTFLAEENEGGYTTGYTGNYIRAYISDPGGEVAAGRLYDVRITERYADGAMVEII